MDNTTKIKELVKKYHKMRLKNGCKHIFEKKQDKLVKCTECDILKSVYHC